MTLIAHERSMAPGRDGRWMAEPGLGVYVHIPFCLHRCHYCDFNTYEGQTDLFGSYVDSLVADILRWPSTAEGIDRHADGPAASVFFGGGTPTLLTTEDLGRVLEAIREVVGIAPDAEVTIEANPETIEEPYLASLLSIGFDRVSIGVQSLRQRVLTGLGRTHDARTAVDALRAARSAGFTDVNADLIYGSAWESDDDWARTLDGVLDVGTEHISAYALTVEEGTPLHTLVRTGRIADVDGDVQARRYEMAQNRLGAAGYERYEVSNWSRPGHASAHNVCYWSAGNYLGFGAGAHAHVHGRRWWSVRLPREFIASVDDDRTTEAGHEQLSYDDRAGEALMLGLRLREGIDLDDFTRRFGAGSLGSRAGVISSLCEEGLLVADDGRLALAPEATLVANDVICRLL